jgi:hypothetical protein
MIQKSGHMIIRRGEEMDNTNVHKFSTYSYNLAESDITIGFSTTNKWRSRLIRLITRSKVSHAWISFYDATLKQRMIMQAETWGYEVRPFNRWVKENTWVSEFKIPQINTVEALHYIASYLGSDYDYKACFYTMIRRWISKKRKNPLDSPNKLMCSESVVRFLDYAEILKEDEFFPDLTSPEMLLVYSNNRNDFIPVPQPELI